MKPAVRLNKGSKGRAAYFPVECCHICSAQVLSSRVHPIMNGPFPAALIVGAFAERVYRVDEVGCLSGIYLTHLVNQLTLYVIRSIRPNQEIRTNPPAPLTACGS